MPPQAVADGFESGNTRRSEDVSLASENVQHFPAIDLLQDRLGQK